MRTLRGLLLVIMLAGLSAVAAPTAHGGMVINGDLWASTTGINSGFCPRTAPCDLVTAMNSTFEGSSVTIEPGVYGSAASPVGSLAPPTDGVVIQGEAGLPRPIIFASSALVLPAGATLSDVEILQQSNDYAIRMDSPANIDHVIAVSPSGITGVGTINDTLSIASAPGTGAFTTNITRGGATRGMTLVNDTAIETNSAGVGLLAEAESIHDDGQHAAIYAVNTIAYGAGYSTAENNLYADTKATIQLVHSDWTSNHPVNDGGATGVAKLITDSTDVKKKPMFVNLAGDNLRERASSPTVNRGADTSDIFTTDLGGHRRTLGTHTDIGAFELPQKPAISAASVSKRTKHAITVTVRVNPERAATRAEITTTRHGTTVSSRVLKIGRGGGAKRETFTISGLLAKTTYALDVVATSNVGKTVVTLNAKTR